MKKLLTLLFVVVLVLSLSVVTNAASGDKIIDNANLLSDTEIAILDEMASDLCDEYQIDVVILTVESTGGKKITPFADDYFDNNGLGAGPKDSGVILVLAMEDRDWALSTHGDAIPALTDYGQKQLMDDVLPFLGDDEYFDGFQTYLSELDRYFQAYEDGNPIDKSNNGPGAIWIILGSVALGLLVGFITISIMKSGMKTIRAQSGASNYVKTGSYQLHKQRDIFVYSQTSKVKKSESSSGGSSTQRSSSERSHGGSSGKF